MADLGADVVKVEDTGRGDYVRWEPPFYGEERNGHASVRSALFLALNRGKRSLSLDLKSESGREVLLSLVEGHDVVLDGFRPGVLDRLGVGYEVMKEANPAIVYCAVTGYGQTGPYADRAGHDMNYLGLAGLLGLTGGADGPPVQAAGQIADLGGGALMAAFGVMVALHERERSGVGQMVDISMADGALSWLALVAGKYFCDRQKPERGDGALNGGLVCYRPYEAADGWVSCGALEPKFWAAFCEGVGRPDLIEAQLEAPGSAAHAEIAAVFRERTRAEWARFNDAADCCIEPILDLPEALASELVQAREMVVSVDQPGLGPIDQLGLPIKLSRTPGDPTRPAPALGADSVEILSEAGFDAGRIEGLLDSGTVRTASVDSA